MMWRKTPENNIKNLCGSFLKQYFECYGDCTGCKKDLQLTYMHRRNSLSAVEDEIGTETESEPEERIRSATLIEKFPEEIFRTTQLIFSYEDGKILSRLREPKDLYAMAQSFGKQNKALWPSELQVKIECIEHKQLPLEEPEPFYQQTGEEPNPMIRADLPNSQVVYQYDANISSIFINSCRANKTYNKCCVNKAVVDEDTLLFESRFESGNLAKAVQVGKYDYELYVHCDLYTQKHTQWYYFQVSNTRKDVPYRFTIVNFLKSDSLYNYGMKPLMYSEKAASDPLQPKGWYRIGDGIKYYRNNLRYENYERTFYSLTWLVEFCYDEDTVYFAHCYPYTYTDLQTYLIKCINDPQKSKFFTQRILCKTLAGNNIYVLTITNPCKNKGDGNPKRAVVMTARVHPGESNASWMMKGFLDYITSDSPDAQILRDNFVFKVVPMLNPDGVIIGNYRCSLSGRDLNRNYKTTMKNTFPPVWNIRNMVQKLLTKREVLIYCDLHGHSRKHNMFMYGCENRGKTSQNKFLQERIFPLLLSRNSPDKFKFESCKFKIRKNKEGTGRVIMWNMGIINSFTLEASFCGSTLGNKKGMHFNTEDYESMGHTFCETLRHYLEHDQNKFTYLSLELKEYLRRRYLSKWQQKGMSVDDVNISKEDMLISESSDAGSDSSDTDEPQEYFQLHQFHKKKKLKTKKQRDKKFKGSKSPEKKNKQKKKQLMESRNKGDNNQSQVRLPSTPLLVKGSSKPFKCQIGETNKKINSKGSQKKQSQSNRPVSSEIRCNKKENNWKIKTCTKCEIKDFNRPVSEIHCHKKENNWKIKTCTKCEIKDFSTSNDGNRINKSFSVDICDAKTETLLASYLNNLGVIKKGKKKTEKHTIFIITRLARICVLQPDNSKTSLHFVETLTGPVYFSKPKKTVRQFSCPAWTENRL